MIQLDVDYLSDEEIALVAEDFLNKIGSDEIPVQIEKIVEYDLGMDIVPAPGIQQFVNTDAFTSGDFSSIWVDEDVYNNRYYRYRFSLAHEVGHVIMHKKYLMEIEFANLDEYKAFIDELDERDHSKMEYQGYTFGGLVLVPRERLKMYFQEELKKVKRYIDQARDNKIARNAYLSYVVDKIASNLSPVFEVSTGVLTRRINNDSLVTEIP